VIKDFSKYNEFERELSRIRKADYWQNLKIVDALYQEARALGIFPLKNPLDGIEVDVAIAWAVNHVRKTD
jgi:hypothetical protein